MRSLVRVRRFIILALLVPLVIQGCGSQKAAPEAETLKQIRVAYELGVDFGKIPSLLAWERMPDYGYEVVPKFYADATSAIQAVIRGDADVGAGDPVAVINANTAGQSLRIFGIQNGIQYALIAPVSITDPAQLQGKRVAYHSPSSMTRALAMLAADKFGFQPEWMVMQGSEVRAEALLSGQIDATVIDYENVGVVQAARPGEYHVLISFAEEFPGLMGNSFFASSDYINANSDAVDAMVEAMVLTYRRVNEDPEFLFNQVPKFIPGTEQPEEADRIHKLIDDLVAYHVWDSNGGFSQEAAEKTVALYVEIGDLAQSMPFDQYGVIDPANRVLDKVGRR
jgi:NitT/TauT family transport system substrate-binding protein